LYFTNRLGSTVKDVINASTIARDVNNPNKTVGKKLDNERIQKPAAIVVDVYNIAHPVVVCAFSRACLTEFVFFSSFLYL